jgi:LPXTG-site transpeptidase (sortase) family protein
MERIYLKVENKLRKVNFILIGIVAILGGYILITPFIPQFQLWAKELKDNSNGFVYDSELAREQVKAGLISADSLKEIPEENRLVIPSIQVNGEIFDGNEEALDKGIWHRPGTSTPDRGGNSVFVAHRFLFVDGPNTFYHLDKVQVGEKFAIFWEGREYDYEVFSIDVVNPEDIEIEEDTKEAIVTLYTCTPLWTSSQRLVVKGRLI